MDEKLKTEFAPAERVGDEEIRRQFQVVQGNVFFRKVVDVTPEILMVLNKERQTVYANQMAAEQFSEGDPDLLFGQRPGEIWGCEHSECEGGCGTTRFCQTCGAVKSILTSQQGNDNIEECRVTKINGEALDLRVWTSPFRTDGEEFTVIVVRDIGDEKRRRVLERIFFHDIKNIATGFQSFTHFFKKDFTPAQLEELRRMAARLTQELIEEIRGHQNLTSAEDNELAIYPTSVNSKTLLEEVAGVYRNHRLAERRHIKIGDESREMTLTSDKTLLRRVVGNLVKNALEASDVGQTVTIGCKAAAKGIEFWVHNPNPMPREVQLQVFKRSFSTKGRGRGLGTYSVRLLTERYLGGKVSFSSSPEEGTTFTAWYPLSLDK
jgi:nitrogen fixation/metabolism regulation signal transduction histidine kinase